MIEEIKKKYDPFSDTLVEIINYNESIGLVSIIMICENEFNDLNNFNRERIKITLHEVSFFNVEGYFAKPDIMIGGLLLEKCDKGVLLDINPIEYFDYMNENPKSKGKIIAKAVTYEFLEVYLG